MGKKSYRLVSSDVTPELSFVFPSNLADCDCLAHNTGYELWIMTGWIKLDVLVITKLKMIYTKNHFVIDANISPESDPRKADFKPGNIYKEMFLFLQGTWYFLDFILKFPIK